MDFFADPEACGAIFFPMGSSVDVQVSTVSVAVLENCPDVFLVDDVLCGPVDVSK